MSQSVDSNKIVTFLCYQGFDTAMYASSWFLTLCASVFPLNAAFRIMDVFICEVRVVMGKSRLCLPCTCTSHDTAIHVHVDCMQWSTTCTCNQCFRFNIQYIHVQCTCTCITHIILFLPKWHIRLLPMWSIAVCQLPILSQFLFY